MGRHHVDDIVSFWFGLPDTAAWFQVDPAFDAVWFARGGYGSNRIAEAAVAGLGGAARQKAFLGYSDGGYLLAALYHAGTGRPVHGPMPVDIRRDGGVDAVRRSLAYFSGDLSGLEPSLDGRPAVAFNLVTLAMLTGTPLMPDLSGHVVMVEEVSELESDEQSQMFGESLPIGLRLVRSEA